MKIAIGCDPNAQAAKEEVIKYIESKGYGVGTVNGKELKSPVDGTITSIAPSNESVPSNYNIHR